MIRDVAKWSYRGIIMRIARKTGNWNKIDHDIHNLSSSYVTSTLNVWLSLTLRKNEISSGVRTRRRLKTQNGELITQQYR